jgi:hypothetical protein
MEDIIKMDSKMIVFGDGSWIKLGLQNIMLQNILTGIAVLPFHLLHSHK